MQVTLKSIMQVTWIKIHYAGHLENIFVPDLNNPAVSLNAFQVLNTFNLT